MPFDIEMTGAGDYGNQIKMAICGQAGAGKTLFSSTAPQPLFIFFREQPRIMSIADRFMPHIKVLPDMDGEKIKVPVEDKMHEVLEYLRGDGAELYDTVVIDTGDELQRALKDGKKLRNRGAWHISDWGWLSDVYYGIVNAYIDLPMNVIVLYHLKNTQEGDDGTIFKELALQGASKDDAPGWFDVVGVLASFESVDEKGRKSTSRGMLTEPTPRYGWVKDHSGKLPRVFEISHDFVGDFDRISEIIYGGAKSQIKSEHEVLETVSVEVTEPAPVEDHPGVPTPAEVDAKKAARPEAGIREKIEAARAAKEGSPDPGELVTVPEKDKSAEPAPDTGITLDEVADIAEEMTSKDATPAAPEVIAETETLFVAEDEENAEGDPVPLPTCEAIKEDGTVCGVTPMVEEYVNGEATGNMIVDETLVNLGMVRFRKKLCQAHLKEARQAAKK